MTADPILAVGGENLIDLIQEGDAQEALEGGSPYNVAIAAGRQSVATVYLSPISQDDWGAGLLARLEASGVRHVGTRPEAPTTMAIATKDGGRVDYTFRRDGTAETLVDFESLSAAMPPEAAAFHVGSLALIGGAGADAWARLCEASRAAGRFVSIDPNVRPTMVDDMPGYRARIDRVLKAADLVKLSDEDLEFLYPGAGFDDAVAALRADTSAHMVVVTLGEQGAVGFVGGVSVRIPAPAPDPFEDAVGAGDTFMATLIAGLAEADALYAGRIAGFGEADLRGLMARAAMAAKLNCEQKGCNPPTRAAVMAALG